MKIRLAEGISHTPDLLVSDVLLLLDLAIGSDNLTIFWVVIKNFIRFYNWTWWPMHLFSIIINLIILYFSNINCNFTIIYLFFFFIYTTQHSYLIYIYILLLFFLLIFCILFLFLSCVFNVLIEWFPSVLLLNSFRGSSYVRLLTGCT